MKPIKSALVAATLMLACAQSAQAAAPRRGELVGARGEPREVPLRLARSG